MTLEEKIALLKDEFDNRLNDIVKEYTESLDETSYRYGEEYFCIIDSEIVQKVWEDSVEDTNRYNLDNCFRTYEQAEFKITKDRIFSRIKDYTVKEIVKDKSLYYILYDFESNKVRSLTLPSGLYSPHCFDSKDKIADMIAEIGIEKLKRYFFGVEV